MATKIYTVAILLFIAMATTFSTCKKGGLGCVESSVFFNVDARVYPDKDSINIGNTIFVEINVPTTLNDQNNKSVDYSNASNLGTSMGFVKLISDSPIVSNDAVPDFEFDLIQVKKYPLPMCNYIKIIFLKNRAATFLNLL